MGRDVESGKKKNGEQRCELKAHINSRKKNSPYWPQYWNCFEFISLNHCEGIPWEVSEMSLIVVKYVAVCRTSWKQLKYFFFFFCRKTPTFRTLLLHIVSKAMILQIRDLCCKWRVPWNTKGGTNQQSWKAIGFLHLYYIWLYSL